MNGEQSVTSDRITKAVRARGRTVLFTVRESEPGALFVDLTADASLDATVTRAVFDRVGFFLSIDDDLKSFYERASTDPSFRPLIDSLHGFHHVKLGSPFENACWAILGQRCPQNVARKMKDRLVEKLGHKIVVAAKTHRAFPEAEELAAAGEAELARTIGHAVKARRIYSAAIAFATADEKFLRHGDIEDVHRWLTAIEGIGAWSAAFVLFRGLGRTERLAGSEAQLLPAMQKIYGEKKMPDVAAFKKFAARYGDQQGYWALYAKTAASENIGVEDTRRLGDLGSIGPAMLRDFEQLGITSVAQLARQQPRELYDRLCVLTGTRQDPCVEDTFTCAVAQARDPFLPEEQRQWWYWSRVRKNAVTA